MFIVVNYVMFVLFLCLVYSLRALAVQFFNTFLSRCVLNAYYKECERMNEWMILVFYIALYFAHLSAACCGNQTLPLYVPAIKETCISILSCSGLQAYFPTVLLFCSTAAIWSTCKLPFIHRVQIPAYKRLLRDMQKQRIDAVTQW